MILDKLLNENAVECCKKMEYLCFVLLLLQVYNALSSIRSSMLVNKLVKVKPVGDNMSNRFVPLTEIPPPHISNKGIASGRRHLPDECTQKPPRREVFRGPKVDIIPEYYDDRVAKKVDIVVIPDHIDHKHFEVTTQVPYLTVGPIEAIGYHPSTMKSEHPSECEKIYQEHLDEQYSEESQDYSEESLEMARMPLFLQGDGDVADELTLENLYEES